MKWTKYLLLNTLLKGLNLVESFTPRILRCRLLVTKGVELSAQDISTVISTTGLGRKRDFVANFVLTLVYQYPLVGAQTTRRCTHQFALEGINFRLDPGLVSIVRCLVGSSASKCHKLLRVVPVGSH